MRRGRRDKLVVVEVLRCQIGILSRRREHYLDASRSCHLRHRQQQLFLLLAERPWWLNEPSRIWWRRRTTTVMSCLKLAPQPVKAIISLHPRRHNLEPRDKRLDIFDLLPCLILFFDRGRRWMRRICHLRLDWKLRRDLMIPLLMEKKRWVVYFWWQWFVCLPVFEGG